MKFGSYSVRFIHLCAVWAFAVSQPTFSLLQGNPEFLVVRDSTRIEVITFAVLLAVGPPSLAIACEWVVSRWMPWGSTVHLAFLFGFLVPIALQILKPLDPSKAEIIVTSLLMCVVGVSAYAVLPVVRLFLTFSVILPILGFASFAFSVPLATDDADAAEVEITVRPPIVMVVLDEFPVSSLMTGSGRIDAVRYPNFARLAREATWYRNATTVHWHTTGAVPAMLTGKLPEGGELPGLADHPWNLFTLLAKTYALQVHEEITHLCPKNYCPRKRGSMAHRVKTLFADLSVAYLHRVLPAHMAKNLPSIEGRWGRFIQQGKVWAAQDANEIDRIFSRFIFPTGEELERFLGEFSRDEKETLHFIHLLLPHVPWAFFPSGHRYGFVDSIDAFGRRGNIWHDEPALVQQSYQRHLLQVQYTDAVIGRILAELEEAELYERALVVIVGDHGASFRPGVHRREVTRRNIADIAAVPMFVRYPGQQRGIVDDRAVRTVDILPTIAEVLRVRAPWRTDGVSLLRLGPINRDVAVSKRDGTFLRVSIDKMIRDRAKAIRRKASIFGEGRNSLFELGANRGLLGSRVGRFSRTSGAVRVRLEEHERFANVQRSSGFVPARISGVVEEGQIDPDAEIAIAVNGRIHALTRPFREIDTQRFRALVPESAFNRGFNRVEIYVIKVDGGKTVLVRVGASPGSK